MREDYVLNENKTLSNELTYCELVVMTCGDIDLSQN